jgi:hypothetical protein
MMPPDANEMRASIEPAPRPRSALVFLGFALVIAIDTALVGSLNPDRATIQFWIKLVIIDGGLLLWSLWIAHRLRRGTGVVAAYSFLGSITGLVLIGFLIQLVAGYGQAPPFPGMRVLSVARIASGLYLLFAWVVLLWETLSRSRRSGRVDDRAAAA